MISDVVNKIFIQYRNFHNSEFVIPVSPQLHYICALLSFVLMSSRTCTSSHMEHTLT